VPLEVTADSNIYISALVFAGRPLQFLEAARAGVFRLAVSDALLAEVYRIRDKFRWLDEDLAEAATDWRISPFAFLRPKPLMPSPKTQTITGCSNARSPQARATLSPATPPCSGSAGTAAFRSCASPTSWR
jgi:hypothetical protein